MASHGINAFVECPLGHVDQANVETLCRGGLGDAAAHRPAPITPIVFTGMPVYASGSMESCFSNTGAGQYDGQFEKPEAPDHKLGKFTKDPQFFGQERTQQNSSCMSVFDQSRSTDRRLSVGHGHIGRKVDDKCALIQSV